MAERDDFARAIADALRDDSDESGYEAGYVDAADLDSACIDGWFHLRAIADRLIAEGWTRGDPSR